MYGCRATHPGYTSTLHFARPWIPFRTKFFFTAAILLILGLDIALVYGLYRLLAPIF
jgi:hypothetical protein